MKKSPSEQLVDVLEAIEAGRVTVAGLLASARRQAMEEREAGTHRPPLSKQYEDRSHRGIARDWHSVCTDNDCWCWGSEHHNPRRESVKEDPNEDAIKMIARMNRKVLEVTLGAAPAPTTFDDGPRP